MPNWPGAGMWFVDVSAERGVRRTVILLCILLALWLGAFAVPRIYERPSGQGLAADYGMMIAASQILNGGGNPYDRFQLDRVERALLLRQGLHLTRNSGIVRVGYPPFVYWFLQPLGTLPYQLGALCWILVVAGLSGVGFLAALRYFGWRRLDFPLLLFLVSPPVLIEIYHANVLALVFVAVACALLLMDRFATLSGVVLALSWVKPQVGLSIVLLIVLFHAPRPWRLLAGFVAGTAALLALTILTIGWRSLIFWLRGLTMYAHDVAPQHVVASLSGIYVLWAPLTARLLLTTAGICIAAILTFVLWRRTRPWARPPFEAVAWLWIVWFLATPYSHVNDEMLLAIPVLAVVGPDGERLAHAFPPVALILLCADAIPYAWIVPGLVTAALILVGRSAENQKSTDIFGITVLALMIASLLPFVFRVPVRKEPLLLMGVALCLAQLASGKLNPATALRQRRGRTRPHRRQASSDWPSSHLS